MNKPWAKGLQLCFISVYMMWSRYVNWRGLKEAFSRASSSLQRSSLCHDYRSDEADCPCWDQTIARLRTHVYISAPLTHDSCPYRLISPHKLFVDGVKHLSSCEENTISALYEIKNLRGGILFSWEGKRGLQGKAASTYENSSHSPRLSATFTKMCRLG